MSETPYDRWKTTPPGVDPCPDCGGCLMADGVCEDCGWETRERDPDAERDRLLDEARDREDLCDEFIDW